MNPSPEGSGAAPSPTGVQALVWPEVLTRPASGPDVAPIPGPPFTGRWLVRTEAATYLIDLDQAVATRFPGRAAGDDVQVAALRRDGETVELTGVVAVLGHPMHMTLALVSEGVTLRTTTTTLAIEPAPPAPASTPGIDRRRPGSPDAELT